MFAQSESIGQTIGGTPRADAHASESHSPGEPQGHPRPAAGGAVLVDRRGIIVSAGVVRLRVRGSSAVVCCRAACRALIRRPLPCLSLPVCPSASLPVRPPISSRWSRAVDSGALANGMRRCHSVLC